MFWHDIKPEPPPKAEKVVRTPPEPVWLRPDYLPGLAEARAFPVRVMTWEELVKAAADREELIFDVECFPNYFLVCFTSMKTGWLFYIEMREGGPPLDTNLLGWILTNFTVIGFNSRWYDMTVCYLAVAGLNVRQLKAATDRIIVDNVRERDVLKAYKVKPLDVDHIDLIEIPRLRASLKVYAGRLHAPRMSDLPFPPSTVLNDDQISIVRWYCVNDTHNTAWLRHCVRERLDLRRTLGREYNLDLRSKSDAQIAEAVIARELTRLVGKPKTPAVEAGTAYRYQVPAFIKYQSALLNWALNVVQEAWFVVDHGGGCSMPETVRKLRLQIAGSTYQMGIGGLHSSEETVAHHTDADHIIVDKDVTSYYPFIILNCGLAPRHLGLPFLNVYRSVVERRVRAKREGMKAIANALKIVVNGAFGKLGSKYSILYSPDLMIQVTLTGQLSLLMLIERLELAGISVVSANTDGITIKCPRAMRPLLDEITRLWELDTGFETEETVYSAVYSRDVNNYIAIRAEDDTTKTKGAYWNPWSPAEKDISERLCKNPTATICVEAVEAYLIHRTPLIATIQACHDLSKFVVVRNVKGGAVKVWEGGGIEYLGKVVRWYHATGVSGELVYATSGNKVPRSEGARPLMQMLPGMPGDVNIEWYEREASRILQDIGAVPRDGAPVEDEGFGTDPEG